MCKQKAKEVTRVHGEVLQNEWALATLVFSIWTPVLVYELSHNADSVVP